MQCSTDEWHVMSLIVTALAQPNSKKVLKDRKSIAGENFPFKNFWQRASAIFRDVGTVQSTVKSLMSSEFS